MADVDNRDKEPGEAPQKAEEDVKTRMLKDPHALVVPDKIKVIYKEHYKERDSQSVFIPKSV